MSDYKQTRDAAGKVTAQYDKMLRNLDDDLVKQLRDRIDVLEAKLTTAVDALETIRFFSGVHAAGSDLEHIKESVNDVANKALVTVK